MAEPGWRAGTEVGVRAAVFLSGIAVTIAFFTFGQTVFGPLATAKVNLLTASVMSDDPAGVTKALRAGVFIDVRDTQGATALLQATRACSLWAAEALLQAKANPNLSDINDETPLMSAVNNKQNGLAVHLLRAGADIQAVDANGRTPLCLAASRGNSAMVRRLLKEGADANQADAHGWTPLLAAAASEVLQLSRPCWTPVATPATNCRTGGEPSTWYRRTRI